MPDSNHVQPQQRTTLLAAVGRRLFPDPSLVAQLCHRLPAKVADHWLFPDPGKVVRPLPAEVTNQIIDREASLLKRRKVLLTIARRARDIAMTDPSALRPEVREHLLRRAQRRVPEDQNLLHVHVYRSPHKTCNEDEQQRQQDEQIARDIGAAACAVWEEARNGKWQAFGLDPGTRKRVQIGRAEFTAEPPPLRRVLENRVGSYEAVTLEPAAVEGGLVEKAPPQKGNPPRGYEIADRPLVAEIIELYRAGHCKSLLEAAQSVAHQAKGGGELKSKETRLHRRANQEWRRGGWQKIAEA